MAPNVIPPWKQVEFIYDEQWDERIDGDFIDFLYFEARVGHLQWPHKYNKPLIEAIDALNYNYTREFSYVYGLKKLISLEQRYKTFSWMLSLDGVTYVPSTNLVTTADSVWRHIFEVKILRLQVQFCRHLFRDSYAFICVLLKDRFAYAYLAKGEAKYEELAVMFSPYVDNVVLVSSDDDNVEPTKGLLGKKFVLVDENVGNVDNNVGEVEVHAQKGGRGDDLAIVPYVGPEMAQPLQMIPPPHAVDISSMDTESSVFNWWEEYLDVMSDDDGSTATDASTANSVAIGVNTSKGNWTGYSRYTYYSPKKPGTRFSSTASNSPFGKPPRK